MNTINKTKYDTLTLCFTDGSTVGLHGSGQGFTDLDLDDWQPGTVYPAGGGFEDRVIEKVATFTRADNLRGRIESSRRQIAVCEKEIARNEERLKEETA
jgi:hypothetical protein